MNRTSLVLISLFLLTFCFTSPVSADTAYESGQLSVTINKAACLTSVKVCGKEILKDKGVYPLVMGCRNGEAVMPRNCVADDSLLYVDMQDDLVILLRLISDDVCLSIEVLDAPAEYDAVVLAPLAVSINDVVGDIIGVVQGKGVAFGIQALNIKTNAGFPLEYSNAVINQFKYKGEPTEISTSTIPVYRLAATRIGGGAAFQFSARNRSRLEYRTVQDVDSVMVIPVEGPDALISGAKIALFGCQQSEALNRIGEIEVSQNLPHPMLNGEWAKTSCASMKSYIISDFSEKDLDFMLDKCHKGGFEYLYQIEPFSDWGHFHWNPDFVKGNDAAVKKLVDKAESSGVHIGIHTLTNFMTTDDAYVTPKPSEHLLKQGVVRLLNGLDENQTDFCLLRSKLFDKPSTVNVLQIGNELIVYRTYESAGMLTYLHHCTRGAFGTAKSAHPKTSKVYKLWDHPYKTLFPDLVLQDAFSQRIVDIFKNTGLSQISFDGLEGCAYTGHDDYAMARFVTRCYDGWDHDVINDGSRLTHFNWHVNTRMNWGEPWNEKMREGQVDSRIKNQDFFRRNLFPRMMGWYQIVTAGKINECTSLEDIEWAMSEAAGFDAGYGMTIYMKTMRNHGRIDMLLEAMRNWDQLRYADAFTDAQKERLRDPFTEWHIEKQDDSTFLLYPIDISKRYRCNLEEVQPGRPTGADWQWISESDGGFSLRLYVDGEGSIQNPSFATATGTLMFPCTVNAGQYLLYDFDGAASVTDKNYNKIEDVTPVGEATLPQGESTVSFTCDFDDKDGAPELNVRYITRKSPEVIAMPAH